MRNDSEKFAKDIRRRTRKKYSAEQKIRFFGGTTSLTYSVSDGQTTFTNNVFYFNVTQ
jgi:hypothetical protein